MSTPTTYRVSIQAEIMVEIAASSDEEAIATAKAYIDLIPDYAPVTLPRIGTADLYLEYEVEPKIIIRPGD